jgi:hypothetical protein
MGFVNPSMSLSPEWINNISKSFWATRSPTKW